MFWKKQWKKRKTSKGKDEYEIPAYSKDGGHIKSLQSQGGITTSATYGGMGVRELQLRIELLIEPVLTNNKSVFEPAKLLSVFAKVDQDRFLRSIEEFCSTDIELAFSFCQHATQSLQLVDEENWEDWITTLLNTYKDKGIDAATSQMHNVEGYIQSITHAPSSVTFDEIIRILESFIIGLSGRRLTVEVSEELYTDTETIRLPEFYDAFSKREDNFTLYKAMAVHQWAQSWYGTWRMNIDGLVKTYKDPDRALSLFHKLETMRLDACIKRDLPGIARSMQKLNKEQTNKDLSKNWLLAIEKLQAPDTSVQDTMFFLELVYRDEISPKDKLYQGELKPRETLETIQSRKEENKNNLQKRLAELQRELENNQQPSNENDSKKDQDGFSIKELDDDSMPDGFKIELQFDNKAVDLPEDIQHLLSSTFQDFGEIPDDYLDAINDNNKTDEHSDHSETDNSLINKDMEGVFLYDEWDHSRQKYRKDWCHLKELEIRPIYNDFANKTIFKHRGLIKNLHKTFEALREDDKRLKRQPYGDDIDLDAVIEAYTDTKIGLEASQNLFTKSRKIDRNIAVMFMIDMSGSTAGWINEMEREALVLLCESLEILGDRYAIYGFSGVTHERCELYKVKEFKEEYNDEVKARISGIEPQDYTRMGAAIRHLSKLLHQVEARTKLLITLSDGRPDDQDGYRGPYGIEDTRRALIEAKFLGIHPFCITIDDEAMDYLQHMYGAVNFAVIDKVDKLPYKVSDIYRRITI